jgi:hypothetical protein
LLFDRSQVAHVEPLHRFFSGGGGARP